MAVWLLIVLAAGSLSGTCAQPELVDSLKCDLEHLQPGERPQVTLPLEFDVAPENRLYLYGERVHHVRLTTAPGESLYLNGVPIKPRGHGEVPWDKERPVDEGRYLDRFGRVPFVQGLLTSGAIPSEAGRAYVAQREELIQRLWWVYAHARETGQDDPTASRAALERLRELDTENLVDWERPATPLHRGIKVFWRALDDGDEMMFMDPSEAGEPRMPSEQAKRVEATILYELLAAHRHCWCFIGVGGYTAVCGRSEVAGLGEQLDSMLRTGETFDSHLLDDYTVREILEASKAKAGLPN